MSQSFSPYLTDTGEPIADSLVANGGNGSGDETLKIPNMTAEEKRPAMTTNTRQENLPEAKSCRTNALDRDDALRRRKVDDDWKREDISILVPAHCLLLSAGHGQTLALDKYGEGWWKCRATDREYDVDFLQPWLLHIIIQVVVDWLDYSELVSFTPSYGGKNETFWVGDAKCGSATMDYEAVMEVLKSGGCAISFVPTDAKERGHRDDGDKLDDIR